MNDEGLKSQLAWLKLEHRDLDVAIQALIENGSSQQMQIARLKRAKLAKKDQIAAIEDQLFPDIIA